MEYYDKSLTQARRSQWHLNLVKAQSKSPGLTASSYNISSLPTHFALIPVTLLVTPTYTFILSDSVR